MSSSLLPDPIRNHAELCLSGSSVPKGLKLLFGYHIRTFKQEAVPNRTENYSRASTKQVEAASQGAGGPKTFEVVSWGGGANSARARCGGAQSAQVPRRRRLAPCRVSGTRLKGMLGSSGGLVSHFSYAAYWADNGRWSDILAGLTKSTDHPRGSAHDPTPSAPACL